MSRNVSSSGKHPSLRLWMLPLLSSTLGTGAGGAGLLNTASAADSWDCRAGADGTWQCAQGGMPQSPPAADRVPAEQFTHTRKAVVRPATPPEPVKPATIPAEPASAAATTATPPVRDLPAPAGGESPGSTGTGDRPPAEPGAGAPGADEAPAAELVRQPAPPPPGRTPVPSAAPSVETFSRHSADASKADDKRDPAPGEQDLEAHPDDPVAAQTHRHLAQLDTGIAWNSCAPMPIIRGTADNADPAVTISADSVEATDLVVRALFSGDVQIHQGPESILAHEARYDHASGEIQAIGDALLLRPDLRIAADEIHYDLRSGVGEARHVNYRLPGILARGSAARAQLVDPGRSLFTEIDYTTCPPGDSAWRLSADELRLDAAEGWGSASDAKLYFADVPVMYLPKLSFPIDDRRRSGVLIPSLAYGDRHGADLSVPYYFNLAPNYDLTLTPRLMSRRGLLLDGEFRFLSEAHRGEIRGSYLPHDRRAPAGVGQRGGLSLKTHSRHSERLSSQLNINHVSDDDFLADFGPDIEAYGTSHLERAGTLDYQGDGWSGSAAVQHFQTIDSALTTADRPYSVLPRIRFHSADKLPLALPTRFTFAAEVANFHKDDSVVEGRRLDLTPRLELPFRQSWYHLVPAAGLRYTRYELDNQVAGRDASPDRLAPMLSLDGGLYFDRDMQWFGRGATQSLEPRAFYLYVPEQSQNDIPVFDSGLYGLSFDNLFRENRFTSSDRVGDANQLTLALTSSVNDLQSGEELMRASLGGIVYLQDRTVQLPGVAAETDQTSPIIAEISARLNRQWRTRGELAWNPHSNDVEQALARASYRADPDRIFSAAYRLRETTSSETDLGAIWPLGSNSRAIARWNYSLSEQRNLDALAGFEYGRCCWKIRTLVRQQVTGTGSDQNLSFLLQLELRGLGNLGDDIDSLLKDGIYGYRRNDD